MKRAKPRGERGYPQAARAFSFNFKQNMEDSGIVAWVPHEDYNKLRKKYLKLFKRYKAKKTKC